jgi:peroxiredoxin
MSDPRRQSRVGTPAAPFELVDAIGTRRTLEQYRGRWLLLVFHRHLG